MNIIVNPKNMVNPTVREIACQRLEPQEKGLRGAAAVAAGRALERMGISFAAAAE